MSMLWRHRRVTFPILVIVIAAGVALGWWIVSTNSSSAGARALIETACKGAGEAGSYGVVSTTYMEDDVVVDTVDDRFSNPPGRSGKFCGWNPVWGLEPVRDIGEETLGETPVRHLVAWSFGGNEKWDFWVDFTGRLLQVRQDSFQLPTQSGAPARRKITLTTISGIGEPNVITAPVLPTPTPTATPTFSPTPTPEPTATAFPVNPSAEPGAIGSLVPALTNVSGWVNTEPFAISDLRGQVVLVDFWTYTCINCLRTLPYLKDWHAKYDDLGLEIVGVHAPEFEFEKVRDNVVAAVEKHGLGWRMAQDNDFSTWRAFNNRAWPSKYLVDQNGVIRYTHIGEGAYDETKAKIRELLEAGGVDVSTIVPGSDPEPQANP